MKGSPRDKRRALREAASGVYRAAILDGAERVFGKRGLLEAKMAGIAREAGMAAGTLYNYFDSKEQIIRSLLETRGDEILERLAAARGITESVRTMLQWIDEHRGLFSILIEMGDAEIQRLHGRRDDFHRTWERVIEEGIANGMLRRDLAVADQAAFLMGLMKGFVRHRLSRAPRQKLAEQAPMLVDMFLNGARRGRR